MSRKRAMRYNRAAEVALDVFEDEIRRVHPELATPLIYAELQSCALTLARETRRMLRRERALWDAVTRLQRRQRELEGR